MSDLVTGEAVVLGLRTAKLPSRALAVLLDLVVESVAFVLVTVVLMGLLQNLDDAAVAAVSICLLVLFLVVVPVGVETLSGGRSLGKMALGLRVVRLDGGPIRFRHALVRGLVGVMEITMMVGVPAAITSLISSDGRRLGDIFGGTVVVRERVPAAQATGPLLVAPPQLLAALGNDLVRLDLSAVPPGLWLAIRQLLSRFHQLEHEMALRMAHQLAGDLADRVRWPVPPGVHPAFYLSAVLTERQRRDWQQQAARAPMAVPVPWGTAPQAPWGMPAAMPLAVPPMMPTAPMPAAPMPMAPAAPMTPMAPMAPTAPTPPMPAMPTIPPQPAQSPVPPAPAPAPADSTDPGGSAGTGFALPG